MFILCFYLYQILQIIRTQIHRFNSPESNTYDKPKDPEEETGEDDEENSVIITLAIVFAAFIISPGTDCLGPILELNVGIG